MQPTQEEIFYTFNNLQLKCTFYKSNKNTTDHTILYFHGGGLIYGSRIDLPELYIEMFLDAGYHFLTIDYPLAPESSLADILLCSTKAIEWFLKNYQEFSLNDNKYTLFGRSAGAYLCMQLAPKNFSVSPSHIISFYGYDSFDYQEFHNPSAYYLKFSKLNKQIIDRMIQPQPLTNGPKEIRFGLYLYARQTGKWLDFLQISPENIKKYQLTNNDIYNLPPTFIAHSLEDNDVPYYIAKKLAKEIPNVELYTVAKGEHDFDRDSSKKENQEIYCKLLNWLETIKY